jgi:hypothetical protein
MRAVRTCPSLGQCRRAFRQRRTELHQERGIEPTSSLTVLARAGDTFWGKKT